MAETNSEDTTSTKDAADDSAPVTEGDLRQLKYGDDEVESSQETDETDDTEEADEEAEDTEAKDDKSEDDEASEETDETESAEDTSFVKEFSNIKGDTPEEYARNLEEAYKNSTAEAIRLKRASEADPGTGTEADPELDTSDPLRLYMKQKMDQEIASDFEVFAKDYSQVTDQLEYDKFTRKVAVLSQVIKEDEKRLASPGELYLMAAASLNWEKQSAPSDKEKLGQALKNKAANTKSSSSTGKPVPKSKVTPQMMQVNRMMYPNKSDEEIRKELEPHIQ